MPMTGSSNLPLLHHFFYSYKEGLLVNKDLKICSNCKHAVFYDQSQLRYCSINREQERDFEKNSCKFKAFANISNHKKTKHKRV